MPISNVDFQNSVSSNQSQIQILPTTAPRNNNFARYSRLNPGLEEEE
jgi:hypothetical protein